MLDTVSVNGGMDDVVLFRAGFDGRQELQPGDVLMTEYSGVLLGAMNNRLAMADDGQYLHYPTIYAYRLPAGASRLPVVMVDDNKDDIWNDTIDRAVEYGMASDHQAVLFEGLITPDDPTPDLVRMSSDGASTVNVGGAVVVAPDSFDYVASFPVRSANPSLADPTKYQVDMTRVDNAVMYHGTQEESRIDNLVPTYVNVQGESDCKTIFLTQSYDVAKLYTQNLDDDDAALTMEEWESQYGDFTHGINEPPYGSIIHVDVDWRGLNEVPFIEYSGQSRTVPLSDITSGACEMAIQMGYPATYVQFDGSMLDEPELMILDNNRVGLMVRDQMYWGDSDSDFSSPVTLVSDYTGEEYQQDMESVRTEWLKSVAESESELARRAAAVRQMPASPSERSNDLVLAATDVHPTQHHIEFREGKNLYDSRTGSYGTDAPFIPYRRRGTDHVSFGPVNVEIR